MGVRLLRADYYPLGASVTVMYCSTSEWAFGPVFHDTDEHDSVDRAQFFLDWLPDDARRYTDNDLEHKYHEWLSKEKELWAVAEAKEKEEETE